MTFCGARHTIENIGDDEAQPHCLHDLPEHHEYAPGGICCFCGDVFEPDDHWAKVHGPYSTGAWLRRHGELEAILMPKDPAQEANTRLANDLAERVVPALLELQRGGWNPQNVADTIEALPLRLATLGGATLLALHQLLDAKAR